MISFEELHHFMMLDVFYGVESKATDSIINSIYREYPENPRMGSGLEKSKNGVRSRNAAFFRISYPVCHDP